MRLDLKNEIDSFPETFGCYIMYNAGTVLYVGKSINLRSRVLSYFDSNNPKIRSLISSVSNIEYIVMGTESEALLLEDKLIKKYKPKYNVKLKYNNSYPFIEFVNTNGFASLKYTYKVSGKNEYIGPFTNKKNLYNFCNHINKVYKMRTCSDLEFNKRKEPCILYQMKQCSAPCVGLIQQDEYGKSIIEIKELFSNKKTAILNKWSKTMENLASEEKFEEAGMVRDFLICANENDFATPLKGFKLKAEEENSLIVDFSIDHNALLVAQFQQGLLINQNIFFLKNEIINFEELINKVNPNNFNVIFNKEKFHLLDGFEVAKVVRSSNKFKILFTNLNEKMNNLLSNKKETTDRWSLAKKELSDWIGVLRIDIQTIECYDIAIWNGTSPTASRIVMESGELNPDKYRHYTIKERPEGNNDFEMMKEVIERRIKSKEALPDVFLIDGGRPQLIAVSYILKKYKIENIILIGIAEARDEKEERLVSLESSEVLNITRTNLFKFIIPLRDEAHRFSRKLHHLHEKNRIFNKTKY